MNRGRRQALRQGGGATLLALVAAAGWLPTSARAQSWNKAAFDTKTMAETMQTFGGGEPAQSKDIVFSQTPDNRIDRDPGREESEHARSGVRHSSRHRPVDLDAREDGTEFEHRRAGQGRRQVLHGVEGSQSDARRLRRMTWQIR